MTTAIQNGTKGEPSERGSLFQSLPGWFWLICIVLGLAGSVSIYPLLSTSAVAVLALGALLLWKRGEPPILFACFGFQWLQSTMAVGYCALYNVPLHRAFGAPHLETAAWLSLSGLVALAIGMRLALGAWRSFDRQVESELKSLSFSKIMVAWWLLFLLAYVLGLVIWRSGSIRQFIVPFTYAKWALLFIAAYWVMLHKQRYGALALMVVVEFVSGLVGYFSTYKEVLIMIVIAAMGVKHSFTAKERAMVMLIGVLGIVTSVFWASIKKDYRTTIHDEWDRRGNMSMIDRWNLITNLFKGFDQRSFDDGILSLVARISYTQLFGNTLEYVPSTTPHAGGELWLGAIKHVVMPRIIFRNKAVLDDSERAVKYTGLRLSGTEEATSIGIGYMAESYVDFGKQWMWVPILGLGILMGGIYRFFTSHFQTKLFGYSIGTAILFSMSQAYATSNVKIFGGLISFSLIFWLCTFYLKRIEAWMSVPDQPVYRNQRGSLNPRSSAR